MTPPSGRSITAAEPLDLAEVAARARERLTEDAWHYYQSTADGPMSRDEQAWKRWDLVPRVLTRMESVDQRVDLGADTFTSPLMIAASGAHGAVESDGEISTRAAAARAGILMTYSNSATVPVEEFGASGTAPWWAQVYLMRDRAVSDDYVHRCVAAGASALVVTVDVGGAGAVAPFRTTRKLAGRVAIRANYGSPIRETLDSAVGPEDIARLRQLSGLPVWVKGIMHPADAILALEAGAAGVIVSNHGRRQLAGVAPTASVLRGVVAATDGRAPVLVDGGVRSGADVVRGLALGAAAVGIGRPVLWALAAGGSQLLDTMIAQLLAEIESAMANLGARTVSDLTPEMVCRAW